MVNAGEATLALKLEERPPSPCINVCTLDAQGLCIGCLRTGEERGRTMAAAAGAGRAAETEEVVCNGCRGADQGGTGLEPRGAVHEGHSGLSAMRLFRADGGRTARRRRRVQLRQHL